MSYHPPKLVSLKSKGGTWYVQVTKPIELQKGKDKQIRRSTGTTDRKEAERRKHRITDEIYQFFDGEFDRLQPQPPIKFTYVTGPVDPLWEYRPKPVIPKKDASKRLTRVLPQYIEGRNWNRIKSMNGMRTHIQEFISVVGDIQIDEVKKKHAYQFARYLDQSGYAHSTVDTRVRAVARMLTWCEENDMIEDHKLRNLSLANYGYPGRPWKPFPNDDLLAIFSQELPAQARLCLSLLAITGARLDEISLLRWSQVKNQGEIVYLDLTEAIIKTKGSRRLVPIHQGFVLPPRSEGRLFDYPEAQDGKSQNNASRKLMPLIRSAVGEDDRKALHSFRGTLKDMLRNAGVSKELNDFFTGHASGDVAGDYGEGHSLQKSFEAINKIDISFLGSVEKSRQ